MINYMKCFCFIFTIFICAGCVQPPGKHPHCTEADRVTKKYINTMEQKYGLKPFGSGGAMLNEVKGIYVYFSADYPASISSARELVVRMAQILLEDINEDERLRPHLAYYPFEAKSLQIGISFVPRDPDNAEAVDAVHLIKGKVNYNIVGPNRGYKEIYEEPYEQAEKIVESHTAASL